MQRKKILLAGQQNAGKSTLFNMLTGARQHVANYPGVTVDKKMGYFANNKDSYQLIDLPGTYSLTSFSLEERVARKALREESADVILNVMDAANINRSLHLTLQLLELELPVVVVLNMMDIAKSEGIYIDSKKLKAALKLPVVECIGRLGKGVDEICHALSSVKSSSIKIAYPKLESAIEEISTVLSKLDIKNRPAERWLALRLLENDQEACKWLTQSVSPQNLALIQQDVFKQQLLLKDLLKVDISEYIIVQRQLTISNLLSICVKFKANVSGYKTFTQKIDAVVLNRFTAPFFLIATVFAIYQCSIVYGYELTNYWWPYLASFRELIAGILPAAGFLHDPYIRSLGLWIIDSANTLLNYIPIFVILFALIAILEDSGYMARIAFISDKLLHKFGLHGQSTLPMILSGLFAGGCAVPGVMATKGIPDKRARLATILTVPYMNCMAKIPLYALLLSIFFVENKSLMTFYISTISIIAALLIAKLLTKTVLSKTETAPFIMELPRYNLPTIRGVLTRSIERTWMYIRKVGTVVLTVSTVIFLLLQFPGVPADKQLIFQQRSDEAIGKFYKAIQGSEYANSFDETSLPALVNFYFDYKRAKLNAQKAEISKQVNIDFKIRNRHFFAIISPAKGDESAKIVNKALRKLGSTRKKIRREMKDMRLEASLLGSFGRVIEPVSQFAGFDWKINVALLSSFVARENSVATLGVLFQQNEDSNQKLEKRIGNSSELIGHGEVAAVALILFFILYPPCLATVMMIKVQTGEYKWMLLSIVLPSIIGFLVSTVAYSIGTAFNLRGIEVMSLTYFTGVLLLLLIAFRYKFKRKVFPESIVNMN